VELSSNKLLKQINRIPKNAEIVAEFKSVEKVAIKFAKKLEAKIFEK
jgi:hypothetical protein